MVTGDATILKSKHLLEAMTSIIFIVKMVGQPVKVKVVKLLTGRQAENRHQY
jgi:hypothetical protein